MINLKETVLLRAMDRALAPRNQNGLIEPMIFDNQAPETLIFPAVTPDANGRITPMFFADEFADGAIPNSLVYAAGHLKPERSYKDWDLDAICFDDPHLNLPIHEQVLLARSADRHLEAYPVLPPACNADEDEVCATVVCRGDSMVLTTPKGERKLANFTLAVSEVREVVDGSKKPQKEILVSVHQGTTGCQVIVGSDDIDGVLRCIQSTLPSARLFPEIRNANAYLVGYIRDEVAQCRAVTIFRATGFHHILGRWLYVVDDAALPAAGVRTETGKHVVRAAGLSAQAALRRVLGILQLSPREELMLSLLLVMHLGSTFALFEAAGCQPRFVTFLAGETGSLKTAMTTTIFRLFKEDAASPAATFRDTATALEKKLGEARGRVLLVDDFCPSVTETSRREMLGKLEGVIRFVGDNIGKSRCKPNLEAAEEYPPTGCCVVTGEMVSGTQSSLLRCLVLPIEKGDIDGHRLTEYQEHPEWISTHFSYFLSWCGEHGDELIDIIRENHSFERQHFSSAAKERRLADTGASLILMARVLMLYCIHIGVVTQAEADTYLVHWRDVLEQAIHASEEAARTLTPAALYASAIVGLYDAGRLPLAQRMSLYCAAEHVGFMKDGCWWVRPDTLHTLVCRYLQEQRYTMPFSAADMRKKLAGAGLIEIDTEVRDGVERNLFTRKSSLPDRSRFLVLRIDAVRSYVEHFAE